jgi:hypothetical protein
MKCGVRVRTWVDMMLLVCTAMLYNDDPTVLVRTVPAFLLVIATTRFQFQQLFDRGQRGVGECKLT